MTIRYSKTSAVTLVSIPSAMLSGTYDGTFYLEHVLATDFTGTGLPCGAFGLPRAILKSKLMSEAGMQGWQVLFGSTALYTPLWIDVWNPQTGALVVAGGTLHRPKWARVIGYGNAARFYEDVEIILDNIDYLV